MKIKLLKMALLCVGVGLLTASCDKEEAETLVSPQARLTATASSNLITEADVRRIIPGKFNKDNVECAYASLTANLTAQYSKKAVAPSTCGLTPFYNAIRRHALRFESTDWYWYDWLSYLNYLYASYFDNSKQYFGSNGELTNFAAKQKRDLERFWDMPNEITLKGQHTTTLQNRDALASIYMNLGATREEAYEIADYIITQIINPSPVLKTTPFLSFDGFARADKLIVIGDGLVQVLNEAGVDKLVAFNGILGHEWGHQIQFEKYSKWYGAKEYNAEGTRLTELEADFFSSYYMTHKRGATYNWKRAAEFFELFYNIGDCSFTSSSHHGTPLQRLAASRAAWIVAQETKPMGHILTDEDVHVLYVAFYNDIIDNKVNSSEAKAQLKTPQLRAAYSNMIKHKQELQAIIKGSIKLSDVKNL
ncbi:hypothetical protein ACXYMU_06480 [Pontibacter sp. CAU 1760]